MHDMIGSAGMLRGWVDVWTTHMLWLLAALTLSLGVAAGVELVATRRRTARSVPVASVPVRRLGIKKRRRGSSAAEVLLCAVSC